MEKSTVESLSKLYLSEVEKIYGLSKYQECTPYLSVEDSPYSEGTDKDLIAEYIYQDNEIVIYWKNIKDEESLIRSILHEYKHYLQSPTWMKRYYKQGYSYSDHPYEIAAYAEEENWNKFLNTRL